MKNLKYIELLSCVVMKRAVHVEHHRAKKKKIKLRHVTLILYTWKKNKTFFRAKE